MNDKDKILDIIYAYYPRGIKPYDSNFYTHASYLKRLEACKKARVDNQGWLRIKESISKLLPQGNEVYDYSVLGTTPCYHASFLFPRIEKLLLSLYISVIAPKWTYRFIDIKSRAVRFDTVGEDESAFVGKLAVIVEGEFPDYRFLGSEIHQIPIGDIIVGHNENPSIFDSLFDDLET